MLYGDRGDRVQVECRAAGGASYDHIRLSDTMILDHLPGAYDAVLDDAHTAAMSDVDGSMGRSTGMR